MKIHIYKRFYAYIYIYLYEATVIKIFLLESSMFYSSHNFILFLYVLMLFASYFNAMLHIESRKWVSLSQKPKIGRVPILLFLFCQFNMLYILTGNISLSCLPATVLPAKSDSDIMFCLQSNQGLRIYIYHLCINPIHRIGLIHK